MTGTSIDGIDVAMVEITGRGLAISARLIRHEASTLGELAAPLRAAADQQPMTTGQLAELSLAFGCLHADVIESLIEDHDPDLISAHGQTVYHRPPCSWQLLDPAPIVQQFRCPVVTDLRAADLAAGGQGAPITPLADWVMFRSPDSERAIVNLGGFCNMTILGRDDGSVGLEDISGADVCPCNHLLDAIARRALSQPFDTDGNAARAGRVDPTAMNDLQSALDGASTAQSLGTGDEGWPWIDRWIDSLSPNNLAATAVGALSRRIASALTPHATHDVILAGGGVKNVALVQAIAAASDQMVQLSDELGVPAEAREAMAMAILGAMADDGIDITLPAITGRGDTPGPAGAWRRVEPAEDSEE